MARYIVTSRPGMTPWTTCTTLKDARRESRKAKQIGLCGQIVRTTIKRPGAKIARVTPHT